MSVSQAVAGIHPKSRRGKGAASQAGMGRTFDSAPDFVMILDRDNRITKVNKVARETLGVAKEGAVGTNCYERF